jgi:hypothetical protein
MLNTDLAKKFARHYLAMKKCDKKAKEIRKLLEQWNQPLLDHMVDEEMNKISFKGGDTLSIDEKIWAKILAKDEFGETDTERVVVALRAAGLDDLIVAEKYNHNSLAGYLRELAAAHEPLPEALEGIIVANPVKKLVVKKLK